eukprot:TRINITY_DN3090_c0_g1_i4.p1 TRINITY_DN3090_c0_g1~~TRINITY_DN3090_c0_g1_i4.p1  ORF type:complete len:211 (-),score=31.07 TRINITY_DN3090_c0_g1_i4:304-858(-)
MNKRKRIETIAKQKKKVCVFGTKEPQLKNKLKTTIANTGGIIVTNTKSADVVIAETLTPEKRDTLEQQNVEIFSPSEMLLFWELQDAEEDLRTHSVSIIEKYVDVLQKNNALNQIEQTTAPAWFKNFDENNRAYQKKLNKRLKSITSILDALLTDLNHPSLLSNPLLLRPKQSNTGNTGTSSTG